MMLAASLFWRSIHRSASRLRSRRNSAFTCLSASPAINRSSSLEKIPDNAADADMEDAEAKLRRAQLFDVSVRAGVDEFLDSSVSNPTPYFALVSVGISFGVLWQGGANDRAAAARKRMLAAGHDPLGVDATLQNVETTIELEGKRAEQNAALVAELERQLTALDKVGGDDSKRYRQTVWFDFVKAKAEQAYLTAHLDSLHEVLGAR